MSVLMGQLRCSLRATTAGVVLGSAACGSEPTLRAPSEIQHVLRVQGDGGGSGTVTSPDASPQLSCVITRGAVGGVCAGAYPVNSAVWLVATPNAGSKFLGWSGSCAGTDQCVTEMSQERVVTAAFAPSVTAPR